jgi:hypothetical protein
MKPFTLPSVQTGSAQCDHDKDHLCSGRRTSSLDAFVREFGLAELPLQRADERIEGCSRRPPRPRVPQRLADVFDDVSFAREIQQRLDFFELALPGRYFGKSTVDDPRGRRRDWRSPLYHLRKETLRINKLIEEAFEGSIRKCGGYERAFSRG